MSFVNYAAHAAIHVGAKALGPVTSALEQASNSIAPNTMPDAQSLIHLYVHGWINEEQLYTYGHRAGMYVDLSGTNAEQPVSQEDGAYNFIWTKSVYASQELPTLVEAFELANRGQIKDKELSNLMHRQGYWDISLRSELSKLRYEVPGPADLVRFAVRHIFEPDLIKELGYPDEREKGPYLLDVFHQAAGINYPIFTGPLAQTVEMVTGNKPEFYKEFYAAAKLKEPTWADAYWWAHWVLPSPMQAYQMYFRLRPDRDRKFDPPEAVGQNFPYKNLDLLLRANDYPPKFRPLLAAISRPIPGIRFIRQLRAYDVYTYADVRELFLRMGYALRDATDLANAVEKNNQAQKTKELLGGVKKQVIDFVRQGMMTDEAARQMLSDIGVSPEDTDKFLRLGHVEDAVNRTREFVRAVKSAFTKGKLSRDQAVQKMQQFGLVFTWIDAELPIWELNRDIRTRELTALQNVQYACKGLLTLDELQNRLENLGYQPADVVVLRREAELCQAGLAAKALAAQQRAQAASQRALRQQQRDAATAIREARTALARHGSPVQLRRWFCEGSVGEGELYERLNALGWPDDDIARLIGDCKSGKSSGGSGRGGARAPHSGNGVGSTGGGG